MIPVLTFYLLEISCCICMIIAALSLFFMCFNWTGTIIFDLYAGSEI